MDDFFAALSSPQHINCACFPPGALLVDKPVLKETSDGFNVTYRFETTKEAHVWSDVLQEWVRIGERV